MILSTNGYTTKKRIWPSNHIYVRIHIEFNLQSKHLADFITRNYHLDPDAPVPFRLLLRPIHRRLPCWQELACKFSDSALYKKTTSKHTERKHRTCSTGLSLKTCTYSEWKHNSVIELLRGLNCPHSSQPMKGPSWNRSDEGCIEASPIYSAHKQKQN